LRERRVSGRPGNEPNRFAFADTRAKPIALTDSIAIRTFIADGISKPDAQRNLMLQRSRAAKDSPSLA